jgi:Terpene cyclase DEP1
MGNQKLKGIYLGLAVAGLILPYWQFVPWVAQNGLDMRLFVQQLFANRISGFFAMDVLLSAVGAIVFIRGEGTRLGMRRLWLPIVAICGVGVSLGLPLFLYMRESRSDQREG